MYKKTTQKLVDFIEKSPSCYHVIYNMKEKLEKEGFIKLLEGQAWNLVAEGKYYVTRNDSSIIAFKIPNKDYKGYQIISSHSDSPSFKIKENPEMEVEKHYLKLNVEKYGSMLCAPWFDRPLSVAGRVLVKEDKNIVSKLVHVDKDLLMIPNLAIHMNREVNEGYKYNPQVDMLPLFGDIESKGAFLDIIATSSGVKKEDVLSSDLFIYNRTKASFWGANEEFVSSPKLDDLQCAYASLCGFIKSENENSVLVHCVLDNEEVGSGTKQGAGSTFLKDILRRINSGMGRDDEGYHRALAGSFMISADNAHAVHPNIPEKTDPTNRPYPNGGVVIKYSANQKYTTDAVSAAIFKHICEMSKIPYQSYVNRSDMLGGSTLGNISNTQVPMNTVDVGAAQLAMHSPYETVGIKDTYYLVSMAEAFFCAGIYVQEDGSFQVY